MGHSIYLADDEKSIRELLHSFLASDGYTVRSFESGDALLAAYRVNQQANETLEDYLNARVFAGAKGSTIRADAADEAGLDAYTARFHQALSAEKAAIADMD